jgi:hypothetical protein
METKLVEKFGNGNGLGLFRPIPEITLFIRYFTASNKFGNLFVNFSEKY